MVKYKSLSNSCFTPLTVPILNWILHTDQRKIDLNLIGTNLLLDKGYIFSNFYPSDTEYFHISSYPSPALEKWRHEKIIFNLTKPLKYQRCTLYDIVYYMLTHVEVLTRNSYLLLGFLNLCGIWIFSISTFNVLCHLNFFKFYPWWVLVAYKWINPIILFWYVLKNWTNLIMTLY